MVGCGLPLLALDHRKIESTSHTEWEWGLKRNSNARQRSFIPTTHVNVQTAQNLTGDSRSTPGFFTTGCSRAAELELENPCLEFYKPLVFTLFSSCCPRIWDNSLKSEYLTDYIQRTKSGKCYVHFETFNAWLHLVGSVSMFGYGFVRLVVFGDRFGGDAADVFHNAAIFSSGGTFLVSAFYHSFTSYQECGALWRELDWTCVYTAAALQLLAEVQVACYSKNADKFDISLTILDVVLSIGSIAVFFFIVRLLTPGAESHNMKGVEYSNNDPESAERVYSSRRLYHSNGMFSMTRALTSFILATSYLLILGRMLTVELVPGSFNTQLFVVWSSIGGILLMAFTQGLDYTGFPDNYRVGVFSPTWKWIECCLRAPPFQWFDAHVIWHLATLAVAIFTVYSRERILCYLRKDADPVAFETDPYRDFCTSVM